MPALRVLHLPTDTGGNPAGLAAAERKLGLDSTVAVFQSSWLGYPADIDLRLGRLPRPLRLGPRLGFLARSAHRYDVFHFNFGRSFVPPVGSFAPDLAYLRRCGKTLVMTFQGCDARQHGYCRDHFELSCCGGRTGPGLCRPEEDPGKRRRIAVAAKHCRRMFYLNPDLGHVVPGGTFMPYASVDPRDYEPGPVAAGDALTILHAPTNRLVKGTDAVLAARDALAHRDDVRWSLVEGVPNEQALALYRDADLVIDQLRVGWYGAFAVEMMAMGKPVIAYVRDDDLRFIPPAMARALPLVIATPDTLRPVLESLLGDRARLAELGRRGRAYVEAWHDPMRIAAGLQRIYADADAEFWPEDRETVLRDSDSA